MTVFSAFQAIELALQGDKNKKEALEYISNDSNVHFFWCCVTSTDNEECAHEVLHAIVELWLSICGFSMAAAYMEDYKISREISSKGKRSLRKKLRNMKLERHNDIDIILYNDVCIHTCTFNL